jgi:chromosome segregation ATPase
LLVAGVKLTFLEWFEENADEIETSAVGQPQQQRQSGPTSAMASPRDEESICELQSAMLDAKNQRKRVEEDVKLLANRLAHLRAEDARTQKRIDEANRRAVEIEAIKKRNEERQRAKQRAMEQMQRDIKATCEYNSASDRSVNAGSGL